MPFAKSEMYFSTCRQRRSRIFRAPLRSKLQSSLRQLGVPGKTAYPCRRVVQLVNTAVVLIINYKRRKVSDWNTKCIIILIVWISLWGGCFIEWYTCSFKTTNIYKLILLNIPVSCLENYKMGAIMLKVAEVGGLEIPNILRTKLLVHIN